MRRASTLAMAAAIWGFTTGCAWTDRGNRPVWNAFEENLVPDGDAAFWVTLPLTVPAGFLSILIDTLVVHPAQVVDDAAADAIDLWEDLGWREEYYTEMGFLPLRALATPVVFLGSFLGRSAFDLPDHGEIRGEETETAADRRTRLLQWLRAVATGQTPPLQMRATPDWDPELADAFDAALAGATASGRLELYAAGRRHDWPPWTSEPWMGLRDRDPVVRYLQLRSWHSPTPLPEDLRAALLADENEMVREMAREQLK